MLPVTLVYLGSTPQSFGDQFVLARFPEAPGEIRMKTRHAVVLPGLHP